MPNLTVTLQEYYNLASLVCAITGRDFDRVEEHLNGWVNSGDIRPDTDPHESIIVEIHEREDERFDCLVDGINLIECVVTGDTSVTVLSPATYQAIVDALALPDTEVRAALRNIIL